MKTRYVLMVAIAAAVLGASAGLLVSGPGPLWRSAWGQRLLQGWLDADAPPPPPGLRVARPGEIMPILELPGLDGRMRSLPDEYAGRPLLINLWASWCGPCVTEMPELQRYSRIQRENGVQVVGIALDEAEAVRTFLERTSVTYPILLDVPGPADAGVRLGNPQGVLPYSILIGRDGRVLKQRIGPFSPGELERFAEVVGPVP